jgi:hypothetical protein
MATKKKIEKTCQCTVTKIMDTIGNFAIAGSILLLSITLYKVMIHLISINKMP